jgi:hypothetical protein
MDLGLEVHEQDGWSVLAVSGEIDMATAPMLRERIHGLIADQKVKLVVDLDDVGFLDSTALGVPAPTGARSGSRARSRGYARCSRSLGSTAPSTSSTVSARPSGVLGSKATGYGRPHRVGGPCPY